MPTEAERKAQSKRDKKLNASLKKSVVAPKKKKNAGMGINRAVANVANATSRQFGAQQGRRLQNREFITNIGSQDALAVLPLRVNPGDAFTFPWLAVTAKQFEQYRFHKLEFVFETRVPTTTSGGVILSPEYDNMETAVPDEARLLNTRDAVDSVLWKDLRCRLTPEYMYAQGPRKQVASGDHANRSLYDSAIMYVGTQQSGATPIPVAGKLWVEYDVEFWVPARDDDIGQAVTQLQLTLLALQVIPNAVSTTILWTGSPINLRSLSYDAGTGFFTLGLKARYLVSGYYNCNVDGAPSIVQLFPEITGSATAVGARFDTLFTPPAREQRVIPFSWLVSGAAGATFALQVQFGTAMATRQVVLASLTIQLL